MRGRLSQDCPSHFPYKTQGMSSAFCSEPAEINGDTSVCWHEANCLYFLWLLFVSVLLLNLENLDTPKLKDSIVPKITPCNFSSDTISIKVRQLNFVII